MIDCKLNLNTHLYAFKYVYKRIQILSCRTTAIFFLFFNEQFRNAGGSLDLFRKC